MKTTMYELLGMIKDGKAPKKVLYDENEYSYVGRNRLFAKYIREPFDAKIPYYLFTDITNMNDEVEILGEPKGMPKKIDEKEIEVSMAIGEQMCANKINEILDYLESKGE